MISTEPNSSLVHLPVLNAHAELRTRRRFVIWLRRLGIAGFLFFLIKGLLWLIVPWLIAHGLLNP